MWSELYPVERKTQSPLHDACDQCTVADNENSEHLGGHPRCVMRYVERSLTWELLWLHQRKAWPKLVNSAGRQKWWAKLRQLYFQVCCSFLKIAQMGHLAVQFDQSQTWSKHGVQMWHCIAWAVTPIWKMKHYCLDTAESKRNFTLTFHTCSLKDAAGITCIFHDTCTSQSRLLLFLFSERALRHLNLVLRFCSIIEMMVPSGSQVDVK